MITVPELLEKYKSCPYVFLSDFDGTISTEDSNDFLIDTHGMGAADRRLLWDKVVREEENFRDAFKISLESVAKNLTFDECVAAAAKEIKIDPGFLNFYTWCQSQGIPVIIVSSGMEPIIRGILAEWLGQDAADKLDIVSNTVSIPTGKPNHWEIVYRHPESGFGHDKSQAILPFRDLSSKPVLLFAGDGISDMSAACHADVLFVKDKGGNDLATFCRNKGYPFCLFGSFDKVLEELQAIVQDGKKPEDVMKVAP